MTERQERSLTGAAKRLGLVALVAGTLVALLALLAPAASASPLLRPQTRVAAIAVHDGRIVGPSHSVLAVQGRERAPNYDSSATGSSVAADDGLTSENVNALTNIGHGYSASNAATLADFPAGSGFSGVYDPASGEFTAYPSVEDPGAPGAPTNAVLQRGGHFQINSTLAARGIDTSQTVGFSFVVQDDGSLTVGWTSRGVNGVNFGTPIAPAQYQQAIIDALETATGRTVR
jgi:hypothetical protein